MTIKVTTTIQREVEREISLPCFFKAWPLDTCYKVIDEKTVICVDTMKSYKGISVTEFSSTVKGYMENERSEVITEDEFNAALLTTQTAIGEKTGNPFIEALKHLKEMTYTACTIEGKAYGAKIDAALSFLEDHQHLLEPKPVEQPAPVLDLSDLPF
jgi:hypothetical protein